MATVEEVLYSEILGDFVVSVVLAIHRKVGIVSPSRIICVGVKVVPRPVSLDKVNLLL